MIYYKINVSHPCFLHSLLYYFDIRACFKNNHTSIIKQYYSQQDIPQILPQAYATCMGNVSITENILINKNSSLIFYTVIFEIFHANVNVLSLFVYMYVCRDSRKVSISIYYIYSLYSRNCFKLIYHNSWIFDKNFRPRFEKSDLITLISIADRSRKVTQLSLCGSVSRQRSGDVMRYGVTLHLQVWRVNQLLSLDSLCLWAAEYRFRFIVFISFFCLTNYFLVAEIRCL